ncbi:MAG: cytochrome oxidase subunit III [Flavobacteriaceae bacterium TMED212]|jgi:cytochrome c oxidase subunit 3|nr:MAG: cytochrome oxidase subunit III [Flavobacteriaceae bacterium TMED212]|tara:strand:+ start:11730 stop:12311 length:582 start_codon:yes stop_codon:yes gene_type:complete
MDLAMNELEIKHQKAKKMMLWVGMISMSMTFAGLTSAYVVSSSRSDWLSQFEMPYTFGISTLLILLSSLTFYLGKKSLLLENIKQTKKLILTTFLLASFFIYFQFKGFGDIIDQGYYFTGAESSITTSFLYVLVLLHLAHLFAGMIVLTVVYIQLLRGSYSSSNILGFELAHLFWHFLDILWIYLYMFVLLYR